ncbi:hypothetical protein V2H45_22800 [Tumidithrix elongata RA019]|uniref:Uncharacterized protein n=1 Tax=Tumidithrix elongata BACA0141 TaxID=2716417 RepID=A0AAW9Q7U8_9CYAN|nr:hypothetical protein [Tumidithrix elongata RA019]
MSKTMWNILGIFTILAGGSLFMMVSERLAVLPADQHPKLILGGVFIAAILVVIATTCFFPKVRPVTLRILGAIGIAGCVFNLIEGSYRGNLIQFFLILVFWLPGSIYLTLKGKLTFD